MKATKCLPSQLKMTFPVLAISTDVSSDFSPKFSRELMSKAHRPNTERRTEMEGSKAESEVEEGWKKNVGETRSMFPSEAPLSRIQMEKLEFVKTLIFRNITAYYYHHNVYTFIVLHLSFKNITCQNVKCS